MSDAERATREQLVELLGAFHDRGWVSGTGGGICGPADGGGLLLAPTHVTHDEIGYVLEGTRQVTVGGITRPVKKGDVW